MNSISQIAKAILVCAVAVSVGCNQQNDSKSATKTSIVPLKTLTPVQQIQKEQAIAAKDKLFASLLGELTKSMGEQGPAKSINVCKTRAPEIAAQINKDTSVRIGRTSFKLRNESNLAPEWAKNFVNDEIEKPIEVALPNDKLGVLLPIRLKATCTLCHGNDNQVTPEVKAAIVSNYPNDAATGFAEGDIRGYFWIEVGQVIEGVGGTMVVSFQ